MTLGALSGTTLSLAEAATSGGIEVDFDATIFVQVGLFILLLLVLRPLLFDPMLKLFEEREKRIDGARLEARHMDEASATALSRYEAAMSKARAAANAERDRLRAEGLKQENEILAKVREKTAQTLDENRTRLRGELAAAKTKLEEESVTLAKDLAARVLGREVH